MRRGEKEEEISVSVEGRNNFPLSNSLFSNSLSSQTLSLFSNSHLRHRQSRRSKPPRPLLPDAARHVQHEHAVALEAAPREREREPELDRSFGAGGLLAEGRLAEGELIVVDDGEL